MPTDSSIYEELLVLRAQVGEQDALNALVAHWHVRLTRYAKHLTGDADGAAEVMQEVWLSVVRSLHRLEAPSHFRPWVYRIVSNKCTDWIRHRVRRRGVTQSLTADDIAVESADADTKDEIRVLRAAIARLPADKRAMLSMFYVDDLSIREIAEVLEVPQGTVKSRLFNARHQLKQILEEKTDEEH